MPFLGKFLFGVASLIVVIIAGLFLLYDLVLFELNDGDPHYREIDSCIDLGGCWDSRYEVCRKDEPNAQALCHADRERSPAEQCECLAQHRDLWLCGMAGDPVPYDTPDRDQVVQELVKGAQMGLNCPLETKAENE